VGTQTPTIASARGFTRQNKPQLEKFCVSPIKLKKNVYL
jgi:hypothetical protein